MKREKHSKEIQTSEMYYTYFVCALGRACTHVPTHVPIHAHVCAYRQTYHEMRVEVKGQLVRVSSHLGPFSPSTFSSYFLKIMKEMAPELRKALVYFSQTERMSREGKWLLSSTSLCRASVASGQLLTRSPTQGQLRKHSGIIFTKHRLTVPATRCYLLLMTPSVLSQLFAGRSHHFAET